MVLDERLEGVGLYKPESLRWVAHVHVSPLAISVRLGSLFTKLPDYQNRCQCSWITFALMSYGDRG